MAELRPWLRAHGGYSINPITFAEASDALRTCGLPPAADIHGAISALHRFEVRGGMFGGMSDQYKRSCIARRAKIRSIFNGWSQQKRKKYDDNWENTDMGKKLLKECSMLQMANNLVVRPVGAVTQAYFRILYWLIYSHVILNAFGETLRLMGRIAELGHCIYRSLQEINFQEENLGFDIDECIANFTKLPDTVQKIIDLQKHSKIHVSQFQIICAVVQAVFTVSDEFDGGGNLITQMLTLAYGLDKQNQEAFDKFQKAYVARGKGGYQSTMEYILKPITYLLGCDEMGSLEELVAQNEKLDAFEPTTEEDKNTIEEFLRTGGQPQDIEAFMQGPTTEEDKNKIEDFLQAGGQPQDIDEFMQGE